MFYDEVDDVASAAEYLRSQPYIKGDELYPAGHSTGGTLTLLTAMQIRPSARLPLFPVRLTQWDIHGIPWLLAVKCHSITRIRWSFKCGHPRFTPRASSARFESITEPRKPILLFPVNRPQNLHEIIMSMFKQSRWTAAT